MTSSSSHRRRDNISIPEYLQRPSDANPRATVTAIQIYVQGTKSNSRSWHIAEREFGDIRDAAEYLQTLFGDRSYQLLSGDRVAKLSDGTIVHSNYSLKKSLTCKIPSDRLVNIIKSTTTKSENIMTKKSPKKSTPTKLEKSTDVIILKKLCQEFKIDPRTARIKLRKAIGKTEMGRWKWVEGSKDLKKVQKILSDDE